MPTPAIHPPLPLVRSTALPAAREVSPPAGFSEALQQLVAGHSAAQDRLRPNDRPAHLDPAAKPRADDQQRRQDERDDIDGESAQRPLEPASRTAPKSEEEQTQDVAADSLELSTEVAGQTSPTDENPVLTVELGATGATLPAEPAEGVAPMGQVDPGNGTHGASLQDSMDTIAPPMPPARTESSKGESDVRADELALDESHLQVDAATKFEQSSPATGAATASNSGIAATTASTARVQDSESESNELLDTDRPLPHKTDNARSSTAASIATTVDSAATTSSTKHGVQIETVPTETPQESLPALLDTGNPSTDADSESTADASNQGLRDKSSQSSSNFQSLLERSTVSGTRAAEQPEHLNTNSGRVDTSRFINRVARAFDTADQRGGIVHLRLSPPELGAMKIELNVQQGGLTATLETETVAAKNVLLDNLPALRERLAAQDIRVDKFEVDVRQHDSNGQPDWQAQQDQREARQRSMPTAIRRTASSTHPSNDTIASTHHGDTNHDGQFSAIA